MPTLHENTQTYTRLYADTQSQLNTLVKMSAPLASTVLPLYAPSMHMPYCHLRIFIHVLSTHGETLDFTWLKCTCLPTESRPAATLWEGASLPINKPKHESMGLLSHSDSHYLFCLFLINHTCYLFTVINSLEMFVQEKRLNNCANFIIIIIHVL